MVIPNLAREAQNNLPISSVVLSAELVDLNAGLSNAQGPLAAHPLIIDGKKLIPSVTREFNKSRDLIVFLQAYEPDTRQPSNSCEFLQRKRPMPIPLMIGIALPRDADLKPANG